MSNWNLYLKKRTKQLFYIGFFSIFINLCMLVLPIYSLQVFSRVLTSRSLETLLLLALIALAMLLLQAFLEFIRNRLLAASSAQLDALCSEQVVEHALSSAGKDVKAARLLLHDLNLSRHAVSSPVNAILFDLPWTPIFILVIFSLHPYLGWFAFTAASVLMLLTAFNLWLTQKKQDQLAQQGFENESYLYKLLDKAQSIEVFDTAKPLARNWYAKNIKTVQLSYFSSLHTHILQGVIKYARMSLQIGVIGLGAWLVILNQVDAGVMLASSILLGRVLAPLDQSIHQWRPWKQSRAAFNRVKKVLNNPIKETRIEMPIDNVTLSVVKVFFRDKFNKLILNNVQFELKPNNALAIIGASGSGKSTLLTLLSGHNKVQQGEVRINGINLSEILPSQRNRLIGYLPQKVELFNASILDNIASFSDQEDKEQRVFAAAKRVGIHELISQLPNAYQTEIGEGALQLSGGQLQLVALARALFHDPKLLLLDEPDSNLDSGAQKMLLQTIQQLKAEGVSIIFITHRTQLLNVADWVIVMEKGAVVDAGKRSDVLPRLGKPTAKQPPKLKEVSNEK